MAQSANKPKTPGAKSGGAKKTQTSAKGNGSGGEQRRGSGSSSKSGGQRTQSKKTDDQIFKEPLTEEEIERKVREMTRNSDASQKADKWRELQAAKEKQDRKIWSILIFSFGLLLLLLTFAPSISEPIHYFLGGLFGNFFYNILWCMLIIYSAILISNENETEAPRKIKLSALALLAFVTLWSAVFVGEDLTELSARSIRQIISTLYTNGGNETGAGVVGGLISTLMVIILGKPLTVTLVIFAIFVIVMLLTKASLGQLWNALLNIPAWLLGTDEHIPLSSQSGDTEEDDFPDEYDDDLSTEEDIPVTKVTGFEIIDPEEIQEAERTPKRKGRSFIYDPDTPEENTRKEAAEKKEKESKAKLDELIDRAATKKSKKDRAAEIERTAASLGDEIGKSLENTETGYKFPPLELLIPQKNSNDSGMRDELTHIAERLVSTLKEYGVEASVTDISRGPTVTRYELMPAPGVKISKITSLTNDIALRLAAKSVRIEAPIPGKPAVGVEIPNQNTTTVRVRELIDTPQFREAKSPVTVCIGKDIEGQIVLADLSKMPHLLIAGSTGSGKSVCMNSMLISMIYKSSPEDLRLILIDPKAVEMDVYNGIPHLLVPVVCDPKKAAGALQWAVSEMLKRYQLLRENSVRNIDGYNRLAEKNPELKKLPRIVIVIDEMADLMLATPKEVEDAISRLAAMARAAGMHMVLATQRPSVDVITGTIKNNIPSRIAFAVSSQIDSRTILDESGAEGLIGLGDMLFNPIGAPKPRRVQGCLVEDGEVESVISFIKANGEAEYDEQIAMEIDRNAAGTGDGDGDEDLGEVDVLFNKAIEVVIEAGQASTAMIQRRLGVGYARAGRLIDQLEQRGVIGPFEGSKPRQVLMTRQQFLEMTMNRDLAAQSDASAPDIPEEDEPMPYQSEPETPVEAENSDEAPF